MSTNSTTSAKAKRLNLRFYFLAGAVLAAGLAAALELALGATAAEATGDAAAGDAEGKVVAAGADAAGAGVAVSTGSFTTELPPVTPGNEKIKASNIKITADAMVAFSNGFCAPRGPKAV